MKTVEFSTAKEHVKDIALYGIKTIKEKKGESVEELTPLTQKPTHLTEMDWIDRKGNLFVSVSNKSELKELITFVFNLLSMPGKSHKESWLDFATKASGENYQTMFSALQLNDTQVKNFLKTEEIILSRAITHSAKFNNTSRDHTVISNVKLEDCVGVSSCNIENYRTMAIESKFIESRLWVYEFIYEGKKASAFTLLGTQDEWFASFIKELIKDVGEFNLDSITQASKELAENGERTTSNPVHCQILLPNEDGDDYLAVTPMPSIAMLQALSHMNSRFFRDEDKSSTTKSTITQAVGGTNAINAGDYNLAVGGKHTSIFATIPNFKPSSSKMKLMDRIEYKINNKVSLVNCNSRVVTPKDYKAIKEAIAVNQSSTKKRKMQGIAQNLAKAVCVNLLMARSSQLDNIVALADTEAPTMERAFALNEYSFASKARVITSIADDFELEIRRSLLVIAETSKQTISSEFTPFFTLLNEELEKVLKHA
ncbi:hypothetical protein VCHA53O466_40033 [Vibrio chagasii]|nr:hypothetical protein VCHA53O466_40033 [Vibrio chagasii]